MYWAIVKFIYLTSANHQSKPYANCLVSCMCLYDIYKALTTCLNKRKWLNKTHLCAAKNFTNLIQSIKLYLFYDEKTITIQKLFF